MQYWLDLTRPAGTVEAEFSIFDSTSQGTTLQLVDDSGTPAIYLSSSAPTGGYTSGIWDKGTAPAISGDCEILARCRFPLGATSTYRRGPGRGQTNNSGYANEITGATAGQRVTRYTGTSGSTLASNPSTIKDSRLYHWRLMQIVGTTIKTVAWDGEYADKPVAWDNEVTDATYTDGFAYFVDRADASRNGSYYALLSVGTEGDPAPDESPVAPDTPIFFQGAYSPISVISGDPVVLNGWARFLGSYAPFTYTIEWWLDQGKTQPTTIPPGLTFYPDDTNPNFNAGTLAGYPSVEGEWWFLITGTDTETNTAVSSPNPSLLAVIGEIEFTGNIADISETIGTGLNVPTAQEFTGGIAPYSYTLLSYDPPDPSWTVAIGSDGVITGTGPVAGADDYLYVRQADSVVVAGDGNYFHEVIQLFPSLYYRMDDLGTTDPAVIEAGQLAQDYGSPPDVANNGTYGASRATAIGNGVFNTGITPGADVGDVSADLGLASPDNMASVIRPDADWTVVCWFIAPPAGEYYPVWSNLNGTTNGGVEVSVRSGVSAAVRVRTSNKDTGQTEDVSSGIGSLTEGELYMLAVTYEQEADGLVLFRVGRGGGEIDSGFIAFFVDRDNTFSAPDTGNILRIGASDGNPVKSTVMTIAQWALIPEALDGHGPANTLYLAGTNPGTSSAYSNPFSITFTGGGVGVKEMYIAKGGSFVSGVPHVAKGGSFVEANSAWVVKNSGWVKVYEK